MRNLKAVLSPRLLCLIAVCSVSLMLSGCGALSQNDWAPESPTNAVAGVVHAGQAPVVGGQLYLYAAPSTGYGNASVSLLTSAVLTNNTGAAGFGTGGQDVNGNYYVATDSTGAFNITGDWTCTAGTDIYFLLVGGNPGGYGTNANLMLMAALGNCSTVPSFTFMNEVSTVASVYALAGFMSSPTQVSSGTSTAAKAGMAAAFATMGNLETISTGVALAATPASTGTSKEEVISITLGNSGGSGYTSTPMVTLTGGGCTTNCATATATESGAKVTKFTVGNSGGSGYTSAPTVTLTGGGCTTNCATGTAIIGDVYSGIVETPPQANINTLASILAVCENSSGGTAGDSSVCGTLFTDTTPSGGTAPANTLQAALNLAHSPGLTGTSLFNDLMPGMPAFSPTLATAPNDWTMPIIFNGGGMQYLYDIAVDGNNNVWAISNGENGNCPALSSNTGSNVVEISNLGALKSTATTGYTNTNGIACPFAIALDTTGNAWTVNDWTNDLGKITSTGTTSAIASGSATTDMDFGDGLAFDASGNIWITSFSIAYLGKYNPTAGTWSAQSTGSTGGLGAGTGTPKHDESWGIAINGSTNDLYVAGNYSTGRVDEFAIGTGSSVAVSGSSGYTVGGVAYPLRLALDQTGNVWVSNFGSSATAGSNTLSELTSAGAAATGSPFSGGGLDAPFGVAVDGGNNIWVANAAACGVSEFSNSSGNVGTALSPAVGFTGTVGPTSAVCASVPAVNAMIFPEAVAIDEAGNVWVANTGVVNPGTTGTAGAPSIPGFITELVGAATPTLTPIAAATAAGTTAAMP